MITYISGLPGHGKTLKMLEQILFNKDFRGRPKGIAHIDGFDFEKVKKDFPGELFFEFDPMDWKQEVPDGSVLFIDECYHYFPNRNAASRTPDHVAALAEHRHNGIDMFFTSQAPEQVDPFLLGLTDRHWHMRRNFGMGFTNVREFQGVNKQPGKDYARKQAVSIKRWKLPKKLFEYYQSATMHTVKRRIPLKLVGAVAVLVFLAVALVNLVKFGMDFGDDDKMSENSPGGSSLSMASMYEPVSNAPFQTPNIPLIGTDGWDSHKDLVRSQYFSTRVEPIEGLPWTQPIFDEVTQPVTFPKPRCVLVEAEDECICHSQQSTRMDIPFEYCAHFAVAGFFDPTIPDEELFQSRGQGIQYQDSVNPVIRAEQPTPGATRKPFTNWNDHRRGTL